MSQGARIRSAYGYRLWNPPTLLRRRVAAGDKDATEETVWRAWYFSTSGIAGSASLTLSVPALTATGTLAILGDLTRSLPVPGLTATGTLPILGAAAPGLPVPALSAEGALALVGSASPVLGAPGLTAAGVLAIVGTETSTLPVPALDATGVLDTGIIGALSVTLPVPVLVADNRVAVLERIERIRARMAYARTQIVQSDWVLAGRPRVMVRPRPRRRGGFALRAFLAG